MSDFKITNAEMAAGSVFFLIMFVSQYVLITLIIASNSFWALPGYADYDRAAWTSAVFAILMILILGLFGENLIGKILPTMLFWTLFAAVGYFANFFTIGFVAATSLIVYLTTLVSAGLHNLLDK